MTVRRETCFECRRPSDRPGQRHCKACHTAYNRRWKRARTVELRALRRTADAPRAEGRLMVTSVSVLVLRQARTSSALALSR